MGAAQPVLGLDGGAAGRQRLRHSLSGLALLCPGGGQLRVTRVGAHERILKAHRPCWEVKGYHDNCRRQQACARFPMTNHSRRSASVGSSAAALRAGYSPNATPTARLVAMAAPIASMLTTAGHPAARAVPTAPSTPMQIPSAPPVSDSVAASIRNCAMMSA